MNLSLEWLQVRRIYRHGQHNPSDGSYELYVFLKQIILLKVRAGTPE